MHNVICQLPTHWHFAVILIVALIEAYLGKTERVRAGSILELIIRLMVSVFKKGETK